MVGQPAAATMATAPASRRLTGGLVAGGSAGVLLIAALLQPAEAGLGTHSQLRLPPCGWILTMDLPCPTCGMTTAFSHAADGHFVAALGAQPLGALLALATAVALPVGAYVALTGSRVGVLFGRLWSRRVGWWVGGLAVAAWLYKIAAYKGLI